MKHRSDLSTDELLQIDAIADRFDQAWQRGEAPEIPGYLPAEGRRIRQPTLIELICVDIEWRWANDALQQSPELSEGELAGSPDPAGGEAGSEPARKPPPARLFVEDYCARFPDLGTSGEPLLEVVAWEYRQRRLAGEQPSYADYVERFPVLAELLPKKLEQVDEDLVPELATQHPALPPEAPMAASAMAEAAGAHPIQANPQAQPQNQLKIGRHILASSEPLDSGGFGTVYKGFDPVVKCEVAIKVSSRRLEKAEEVETFFNEGRILASLDHPNIVPVCDVDQTEDGRCFIASRYIEGSNLKKKIEVSRPSFKASAELVAAVADAFAYAHSKGLVHRDIKPGNILLDSTGKPYLIDFNIARREDDFADPMRHAASPYYMSPEQANHEGHRVDGRSDILSLGVVMYELITGRRPFVGQTADDIRLRILEDDPKPPSQWDPRIPQELERICLKALSKRATDRYTNAAAMAEELRRAIRNKPADRRGPRPAKPKRPQPSGAEDAVTATGSEKRERGGIPESTQLFLTRLKMDYEEALGTRRRKSSSRLTSLERGLVSFLLFEICLTAVLFLLGLSVVAARYDLWTPRVILAPTGATVLIAIAGWLLWMLWHGRVPRWAQFPTVFVAIACAVSVPPAWLVWFHRGNLYWHVGLEARQHGRLDVIAACMLETVRIDPSRAVDAEQALTKAASELGSMAKGLVPTLERALEDPDDAVRGVARRVLQEINPKSVTKAGVK